MATYHEILVEQNVKIDLEKFNDFQLHLFNYLKEFSTEETLNFDFKDKDLCYTLTLDLDYYYIFFRHFNNDNKFYFHIILKSMYEHDFTYELDSREKLSEINELLIKKRNIQEQMLELREFTDKFDKFVMYNEFILKYPKKEKNIKTKGKKI